MRAILAFSILLSGFLADAAVWTTGRGRDWTARDESAFTEFVQKRAEPLFFKRLGPAFDDLRIDCADAVYAWRAFFARERGLPFIIGKGTLTNETTRFDSIDDLEERFVAFLMHLVKVNSTHELANNDTYPIGIDEIRSGDIFLYKFESAPGTYTRHAYLIKNVNTDGTFEILYSTQARREAGLPLNHIKRYSFPNPKWVPNQTDPKDIYRWGFKRFKAGKDMLRDQKEIAAANYEQYELATRLGPKFFEYVKNRRARVRETNAANIQRFYEFICYELKDRVLHVSLTQKFLARPRGEECLGPVPYDTHSTPSRDGAILQSYKDLGTLVAKTRPTAEWNELAAETRSNLDIIYGGTRDAVALARVKVACDFAEGFDSDMARYYDAALAGNVSNHPMDPLPLRWGVPSRLPPSTCPRY